MGRVMKSVKVECTLQHILSSRIHLCNCTKIHWTRIPIFRQNVKGYTYRPFGGFEIRRKTTYLGIETRV